jgi:hypothetical protein
MQTNFGENEIKSILQKARIFNKNIGTYQLFAITDNFDYAVKLSNGKILIKIEEFQDDQRDALTPDRLTAIANRFVSSITETKDQSHTIQHQTSSTTASKKKSKIGLIVTFIVLGIILLGGLAMVLNNPNAIPGVKLEINTPKPILITSRADNSKSGLLKARTTVYATVQNQGGDGNVLITFHVYQDGNDYDRTKSIYLRSNESQDLDMTFDEVKMLGGDITFNVEVREQ